LEIKTERLRLCMASDDEMRLLVEAEADAEMKAAYREMLAGCLEHPEPAFEDTGHGSAACLFR